MRNLYTIILTATLFAGLAGCDQKSPGHGAVFTKADSLAEVYLALQDTVHLHWNMMINDDNEKIKAMNHLLHELTVTRPEDNDQFNHYGERLRQLSRIRFTQKSMANAHVVHEYDAASRALILDLISEAESRREFSYNTTLRTLVDNIILADQRMSRYRSEYDSVALEFNEFVSRYKNDLSEASLWPEPKPFFHITASGEVTDLQGE